jgi:hypothetical protein
LDNEASSTSTNANVPPNPSRPFTDPSTSSNPLTVLSNKRKFFDYLQGDDDTHGPTKVSVFENMTVENTSSKWDRNLETIITDPLMKGMNHRSRLFNPGLHHTTLRPSMTLRPKLLYHHLYHLYRLLY